MPFNPTTGVMNGQQGIALAEQTGLDGDVSFGQGLHGLVTGYWNDITGRSAQQDLQREQQEFDEYMYNQYNSPEALVRQYKEAGLNVNMLGSTSFGTAQSAAGAPAVNGNGAPLKSVAEGVQSIGNAVSQFADVPLKRSQSSLNVSQEDVNSSLVDLYGSEAALNDIQFKLAKDTYNWSLENAEFTAKSAREGYYLACQAYTKGWQEYENLIKEGQFLDNEIERSKWEAKIKEETYNVLREHGYMPDATYLDRFYIDYVQNGDNAGFNKFMQGFAMFNDVVNRSAARFGANGGTLRVGPFEVDASFMEYALQSGMDLAEVIQDISQNGEKSTRFGRFVHGLFGKDKSNDDDSKKTVKPAEHQNTKDAADMLAKANMHGKSKDEWIDYLIDECGYSSSWVRKHMFEIEDKFNELYR